jgi:hypothetical protein
MQHKRLDAIYTNEWNIQASLKQLTRTVNSLSLTHDILERLRNAAA